MRAAGEIEVIETVDMKVIAAWRNGSFNALDAAIERMVAAWADVHKWRSKKAVAVPKV